MAGKAGGVDRRHGRSIGVKLGFAALHGLSVLICLWLAFGGWDWPDPMRAKVMAGAAVLYFLRHLVTLFVLLHRRVELSEGLGLAAFIASFEIGFLLLGAGVVAGEARAFGLWDVVGVSLLLIGSAINTGSELQRWAWKKQPSSKGHCYTGGLFAYSMHVNYLGDSILFTGWAILAASIWAGVVPLMMTLMFVFYHIPALDRYLADRYGAEFSAYAARTAKFVPGIY
jgi:protein-S-isoprenylcysteine O-methyltransferase Ste14